MTRLRGILLLAVTAGVVMAGLTGAARAGYAGADGAITFDHNGTIYALEGGKLTTLVKPDPGSGVSGAIWSPDGKKVVFLKDTYATHEGGSDSYEVQILDVSTGTSWNVLPVDASPVWSPDGTELAYLDFSGPSFGAAVRVVDLHGKLQSSFRIPMNFVGDLRWSPDGRFGWAVGVGGTGSRIYVANRDGSDAKAVTPDEHYAGAFNFSPDGSQIAYVDNRRIDVIDTDGGNWHVLVTNVPDSGPSWSPNGKAIVFTGTTDVHQIVQSLVTIDADGSNLQPLHDPSTDAMLMGYNADWQRLPLLPSLSAKPAIQGTPRVGQSLTADHGAWKGDDPISYAYRWQRCSPSCVDLTTTSPAYQVTKADAGSQLRVVVTATNAGGTAASASDLTAPVPEPAFRTVHARRHGVRVTLSFTVCDDSPAALTVEATDWATLRQRKANTLRHSWAVGTGPGCHSATRSWSTSARAKRTLVIVARDGDGVATKSLRLALR